MQNIFIEGMSFRSPASTAPKFIKGKILVKVDDFMKFAKQHQQNGWVDIDLKEAMNGRLYLALNDFKKKPEVTEELPPLPAVEVGEEIKPEDLPF